MSRRGGTVPAMNETTETRTRVVYVTNETPARWLLIDVPMGLITPPTIELHKPLAGPVVLYHADSYSLPVPDEARQALAAAEAGAPA